MSSKLFLAGAITALAASALLACTESFPRENDAPGRVEGLRERPSNTTCVAPKNPLGRVRLEPAWTGLRRPLAMVDRPDLGLVYVGEMPGRVKVIDKATGAITTAIDLVGKGAGTFYEQGLVGLAIHPTKPYAYVTLERDEDGATDPALPYRAELVRFTLTDGGRTLDPASEKLILRVDRPTYLHYPGTIHFGRDGMLYWSIGDGGSYLVRDFEKQHPVTLLGTIVRIDVDGGDPYAIPPDNPFASSGGRVRPEVWARGFRNPWKWSFDRETGQIWAGDVGDISFEEVNQVERGKDYGWPTLEGDACFRPRVGCDEAGLAMPVFVYPHAEGASVTGGYAYRGTALGPDLVGKYIFGDFVVGRIWTLDSSSGETRAVLLNPGGPKPALSSFGEDESGELYALDWESGTIYRLLPGEPDPGPIMPDRLSDTGCVERTDPTQPASGLVPYDVNVELWSDEAEKKRFVAIPDGTTVHVEDDGDFSVPEGSVLVKEFAVGGKRVETRLLLHHPGGGWSGVTYEWNDAGTDAVRLDGAKEKTLSNGQTWTFPSPAQCFVCHTKGAKTTLGLESLQLNRTYAYGAGNVQNQLTKLSDIGYLDERLDPATSPRLVSLTGASPLEDRARSYLHANCSGCHREGTGNLAPMDFRFGLPRAAIKGCTDATFADTSGMKIVAPGEPERSTVLLRMKSRDAYQMPPLGTHLVDAAAVNVMESWIRQLSTCD